jgi:hypothetical protein
MTLAAAQVVDAIAARLVPTVTAGHVTADRFHPITTADCPWWKVFPLGDDIEASTDGATEKHDLTVECRGYVRAVSGGDDAMHALLASGLAAVHGAQAAQWSLQTISVQWQTLSENGADFGAVLLRLRATYYTDRTAPEAFL